MIYKQTLYAEIKDYINPKILAKNNRYKKWQYGYNADYDFVVINEGMDSSYHDLEKIWSER